MKDQEHYSATHRWSFLGLCLLLTACIFLIDTVTPLGVAGGVPYVAPVLLASLLPLRLAIFSFATISSLLTVLGIFYSPEMELMTWKVLANRSLALFAIWVVALLSYYQNRYRDQREEAFQRIRTLEGIVPICASCKNIRDADGDWKKLETYIMQHSEASFTHGYCPGCHSEILASLKDTLS